MGVFVSMLGVHDKEQGHVNIQKLATPVPQSHFSSGAITKRQEAI
jgi:hypothetical protein